MLIAAEIEQKLRTNFAPDLLQVIDESEKHRGHAGWLEGGESHFHVILRAQAFRGMSRIERHRAVYQALGAALTGSIHALSLDLSAE